MSAYARALVRYLERTYEDRERVIVPVPLDYGARAELTLPVDLSQAEAERVALMVRAWAVPDASGENQPQHGGSENG